jgi:peptidyl-Lys metalloendopeptidase
MQLKIFFFLFFTFTSLFAKTLLPITISQDANRTNTAIVTVSLTNDTKQPMRILTWNTPFEENLNADLFQVLYGDKIVSYKGKRVKRLHPEASDYMTLDVGETRRKEIDLSRYYRFVEEATYQVSYVGQVLKKALKQTVSSTDDALSFHYSPTEEEKTVVLKKETTKSAKEEASYVECSDTQKDALIAAHDAAIEIAQNASEVMADAEDETLGDRYHTWFGMPNSDRQDTIETHFSNIYSALDTKEITFDCTCTEAYYAYVYPSEPYTIYLCDAFWDADTNGTDSQSGTLVHEMAHFDVVADTEDYAYGSVGVKILALDNPDNAAFNSDNYEYFAENNPELDMHDNFAVAQELEDVIADLPLDGNIEEVGEKELYLFTAEKTGLYTFYTTGSLDSFGTLYAENYSPIIYNDDQSDSVNFKFVTRLEAGQRYYLEVREYNLDTGEYTLNSSFDYDTDNDGIGNSVDEDDDNDGVKDEEDAFPLDASESKDNDHDGIGDNADSDDDNDGLSDSVEKEYGLDPLDGADASADFDKDGYSNALEIAAHTDLRDANDVPIWVPIFTADGTVIVIPTASS